MSLVNDMLRDLDQRRNEGDASGARVRLTPASEFTKLSKSRKLYYAVAGLIVVAAGMGYYWMQMNQSSEPQQLNVRTEIASQESATPAQTSPTEAALIPAENIIEVDPPVTQQVPVQESTGINLRELAEESDNASANASDSSVVGVAEPEREPLETATVEADSPVISVENEASEAEVEVVSLAQSTDSIEGTTIKEAAVVSADEQDTLAVQEALRLIARNQDDAAYAVLEEQIIENRYAHQSRETYAKLLLSIGNLGQAYELVEAGLLLAPNHSGFKKVKARLLIATNDIPTAVSILLSRAPEVGIDLEYHEILASAQLATRDYEGASLSYTGLVRQDQSQGKWWYGFAASQDYLGNIGAARQGYNQAMLQANLSVSLRRRSQERLATLSE